MCKRSALVWPSSAFDGPLPRTYYAADDETPDRTAWERYSIVNLPCFGSCCIDWTDHLDEWNEKYRGSVSLTRAALTAAIGYMDRLTDGGRRRVR
ncbi:hypothetical protein EVAR_39410_1 [Eumeta japonica]|uniref:Uncharacterized protein n=1 Tax=Eumeta variegata TaxID=151549 RepID=A0A4C1YZ59_EUMVA|nr:hypothetical protein EVAR_39410_1 [Eumeta japonica]